MNDEDSILAFNENENGTSDVSDGEDGSVTGVCEYSDFTDAVSDVGESVGTDNDRDEYERLIRTRFRELFKEDTQRLINKRFKKYKALEEKVKRLEDEARKYSDIDSLLAAERDRAVRETEDRLNLQFKAMRGRVSENALSSRASRPSLDVSRLTKSERASLASRALKGEKIHF